MERISVVKIGGNVLNKDEMLQDFLKQFAQLPGPKLLVHGGGIVATQLAGQLGVPVQMKEGRRITDDQMIDVVVMTYGGLMNRQVVAKLQYLGVNALGLTGADGNILLSKKRPPVDGLDYGWVGDPHETNTTLLLQWLKSGLVPVLAPLTHDGYGHLLNTNADTMAQHLAVSLADEASVDLIYAFELAGVLEDVNSDKTLIREITPDRYKELKTNGIIHSGMIPKLDNAFKALDAGLNSVSLVKYNELSKLGETNFHDYTRLHK